MDPTTILIAVVAALAVLLVLDLVVAGGAMTGAVASGACAAMGTPWGWLVLVLLVGLATALLWPRLPA
jgi:hypothetical protein